MGFRGLKRFSALVLGVSACASSSPDWQSWVAQNPADADAHWVAADTLLMPEAAQGTALYLVGRDDEGERSVPLTAQTMPPGFAADYPHLADLHGYRVALPREDVRALAKAELYVMESRGGEIIDVSRVQIPWLLDDLYTAGDEDADEASDLGATILPEGIKFAVWAPTARAVAVELFAADKAALGSYPLTEDPQTGIWRGVVEATGTPFYRYRTEVFHPASGKVETLSVTDPYALSLSVDSKFSQAVDLSSPAAKPDGWDDQQIATVPNPEALIIYETHIGDFSGTDESIPEVALRGTYGAFLQDKSDGVKHLKRLKAAGLNTIHLLPTYDLGSIPEADGLTLRSTVAQTCATVPNAPVCGVASPSATLVEVLAAYDPTTGDAQALIEAIDEVDDYNWGYDPYHYTVPEGSYAVNADGLPRIVEFRDMVQRLHEMGFRVVMDVVYNHTFKAGLSEKSVLDKIVPGYYHRLHPVTGAIETSTCCENTATEHAMMSKLMTDSLIVWARDYKIDGFRFDLMGHQPMADMLSARKAVKAVDPDTYFYGEGWNFGEVANDARFPQATQINLAGTEIGTFSDRLRDAIRGGSSFVDGDDLRRGQGLGNGLVTQPNELAPSDALETYRLYTDQTRIGLAGNLATFQITDRTGKTASGADVPYGDQPAGYALDPADTISYVSKHDNQTLWDNNAYRTAHEVTADERTRMQAVGMSFVLYGQGIPFLHMGGEMLRSKSFLRDSFNYGHWFNDVDFRGLTNNSDAGLPPEAKDAANWDIILRLRQKNEGRDQVGPQEISAMTGQFFDMLSVRSGSALFSLPTAQDIKARISFLNAGPEARLGLIVMHIDDGAKNKSLADLDPEVTEMVVVFNHGPDDVWFRVPGASGMALHPVLSAGADPVVRRATAAEAGLFVPGWTTAVFVTSQ